MQGMVELLDAILEKVNSFTFVPEFTLERSYYPLAKLSELAMSNGVKSFLIPGPDTPGEILDRSKTHADTTYSFELGIFKKITNEKDNDEADALMKLADNVRQFLIKQKFETLDNAPNVLKSSLDPSYDQETFNTRKTFLSIIKFEVKWLQNV